MMSKSFDSNIYEPIRELWHNIAYSSAHSFLIVRPKQSKGKLGLWSNDKDKMLLECKYEKIEPIYEEDGNHLFFFLYLKVLILILFSMEVTTVRSWKNLLSHQESIL